MPVARPNRVPPGVAAAAVAVLVGDPRAAILVEGHSDRAAVRTLAARRGRDLDGEGVAVVAMGGVTNLGHYVRLLGPGGAGLQLAGLYDESEVGAVRRGLEPMSYADGDDPADHGFHVCRRDLEDELLRVLGAAAVLEVFEREGEAGPFRIFQRQPAQRGRPVEAHVHRFLGIRSGRKIRYGRLLVEALDLDRVPVPLDAVLAEV